jgi:hypothetical protein
MGRLLAVLFGATLAAPAVAQTSCRSETATVNGSASQSILNCSSASAATIAAVLDRTDAAYEGRFSPGDQFLANSQFVAWIDTRRGTGILRGLWPLNAQGAFVGTTEPTLLRGGVAAYKSLIAIHQGYNNINAPRGYKGLHVEVWVSPQSGGTADYYTYANSVSANPDEKSWGTQAVVRYHTNLVRARDGYSLFVDINKRSTQLTWTVRYVMTPTVFHIETTLTTPVDVQLSGDVGGLLLITNPACAQQPRNAFTGDGKFANCYREDVRQRSLHFIQAPSIAPGTADSTLPTGKYASVLLDTAAHTAEFFGSGLEQPAAQEDRTLYQYSSNAPFTLRTASTNTAHSMTVTPGWYVSNPSANRHLPLLAYHFNATPEQLGFDPNRWSSDYRFTGVSGYGSLDVVFQPPRGNNGLACTDPSGVCKLNLGPTGGYLQFGVDITR